MGKYFDEFKELVDDLNMQLDNRKIDVKAMEVAYMCSCAAHLAQIIDMLADISSKLEEKEKENE